MRKVLCAALCGSLVAACGGGGGDSAGGGSTAQPATLAITSSNQVAVASASANAVASVASAGGAALGDSGSGVAAAVSRRAALALTGARKSALSARPLATASETFSCPAGGSFTLTVNDANNNGDADAGDSLSLVFTNCKASASDNTNGSLSITLAGYTETSAGANFSGTMALNLVATDNARSATVVGSVAVGYTDLTTTQSRIDLSVGSSALTASVTTGGQTETITYDAGFTISQTSTSGGSTSVTVAGGISSSGLAGRIVLDTPLPLVQPAGALHPVSGILHVLGIGGTQLRLTVDSTGDVTLELDADGNGSYELSDIFPWDDLLVP